jgi:Transmembrane domain of unknown function (DUF3566)
MTANAGKGGDGKPGQRSTSTGAKGGKPRKKASPATKPQSDEVTLRTNNDAANGADSHDAADDTVIDAGAKAGVGEDTRQDIEVPATTRAGTPPSAEDTDPDGSPPVAELSGDGSEPGEPAGRAEAVESVGSARLPAFPAAKDESAGVRPGGREPMPDPERGLDPPAADTGFAGSPADAGFAGPPAGADGRSSSFGGPGRGYGSPTPQLGGPPPQPPPPVDRQRSPKAATLDAASKVAKLTGALRKPPPRTDGKPPRKAHLQVARLEPWSVMKFSFVMSLVCFLVLFVAVAVLYMILSALGVFDALSDTIRDLTSNDQGKSGGIDPAAWFSAVRILSYTALIGTLNVLLITALATVWSVIYNMAADLVGGVEVTLKEADQ